MNISIFKNMTSKFPVTGQFEEIANLIQTDEKLKAFTASYRQTGSKTFKSECQLFAVACLFEGGKGQENIKQLTGLSLVDFDHIFESHTDSANLTDLKAKIIADPHTLMCYTTISGNGLRVIYKYELPKEAEQQDVTLRSSLYQQAFFAGNAYYERLLGIKADAQCKNINRLSGLAHDPDVFLRPEAVAFTMEEITKEASTYAKQSKEDRLLHRIQNYYDTLIAPQLAKDGIQFAPGSHNDYVMRVGYKLAERCFSKKIAIKWAKQQFADYADTEQVFTSCFANANYKGNTKGNSDTKAATVDEIKSFLDAHIKLRYNEITTRIEYLETDEQSEKCGQWIPLNDRRVNSLWADMSTVTRVNKQDLFSIIESDYVSTFNPFKDYFERLCHTQIHTNEETIASNQPSDFNAPPDAYTTQQMRKPTENQARGFDAPPDAYTTQQMRKPTENQAMGFDASQDAYTTQQTRKPTKSQARGFDAPPDTYITQQTRKPTENQARGFDAPAYLNVRATSRSGYIPSPLRGEGLGERGGALFNGKEGRGDFRKESQSPFEEKASPIHELAQTITVKGGTTEQLRWEHYLRK